MRHYIVTGDKARTPNTISRHLRFSVICADVRRAIDMAEKEHPGCTIHSVADQGAVDKVDHP